jgi:hypothetical protein
VNTECEHRIEGANYCAIARRNDLRWGHGVDVNVFGQGGELLGSISFVCCPGFAEYELYQQMTTEELIAVVANRLKTVMQDHSLDIAWQNGLHSIERFNAPDQSLPFDH